MNVFLRLVVLLSGALLALFGGVCVLISMMALAEEASGAFFSYLLLGLASLATGGFLIRWGLTASGPAPKGSFGSGGNPFLEPDAPPDAELEG